MLQVIFFICTLEPNRGEPYDKISNSRNQMARPFRAAHCCSKTPQLHFFIGFTEALSLGLGAQLFFYQQSLRSKLIRLYTVVRSLGGPRYDVSSISYAGALIMTGWRTLLGSRTDFL